VIHQLGEIAGKQLRGIGHMRMVRTAMPACIIGKDFGAVADPLHHAVPHAAVERERMDKRQFRRAPA
jgi:hypothetical protein